jgi:membrane associated rhomboid family serine protease
MDIVIIPQHWASIVCIIIMISALVISYIRKIMATYALIVANAIIFVFTLIYTFEIIYGVGSGYVINDFPLGGLGFRSIYLTPEYLPQMYTAFTSMFIHGGFAHIFGNMFIFLFIGMAFEQRIGWRKFLVLYLITGFCGTFTHAFLNLSSSNNIVPLIGASGAIFGIMGAFAYSYPRDEIVMPIPVGIMFITRIKVMYAVIIFAIFETVIVWFESTTGYQSETAHFAHLGGLISGFILAAILIKRKPQGKMNSSQTVYYDSGFSPKPSKIELSNLKKYTTTPELKEMYKKIENETVPQVRDVWLEHFLEKAICPKCKKTINHFDGKIWCEYCAYRDQY